MTSKIEFSNDIDKEKLFLMRTNRGNLEKRREERELDVEDRSAATIAHDLRQLPVRTKQLAKNEIRNTLFRYQRKMLNQRDHVGNVSLNNVAQCSGYAELLKSISPAMTYVINTKERRK